MDKIQLQRLAGLHEDKWSGEVQTKKHPPEGLFANGTSKSIVKWLQDNHKEFKSAMSALNFYINRSGKNLTAERKAELESTKDALRKAYKVTQTNESLDLIRRLAGLPKMVREKEDESEEEESSDEEEKEEEIPAIVTSIAKKIEGLTGDELVAMVQKVYDAGIEDGKAQAAEEKPAEEESLKEDSTTANIDHLLSDFKRAANSIEIGNSATIVTKVSRNRQSIWTYDIKTQSSEKEITESKDTNGVEIKVGDRLIWNGKGGEGTGVVVADPKYNGGMRVGGQAVKHIIDEYDTVKVVK